MMFSRDVWSLKEQLIMINYLQTTLRFYIFLLIDAGLDRQFLMDFILDFFPLGSYSEPLGKGLFLVVSLVWAWWNESYANGMKIII